MVLFTAQVPIRNEDSTPQFPRVLSIECLLELSLYKVKVTCFA